MKKGKPGNSRKRVSPSPAGDPPNDVSPQHQVYCTQCGATLENFCFSSGADDVEAVRKTLAQCRKQGRFSGDFCSKLFIAHPEAASEPTDEPMEEPDDPADDNLA